MSAEEHKTDSRSKTHLAEISRGASLHFIGRIVGTVLAFTVTFVLTRALGSTLYGVFAYAKSILTFSYILSRFGTEETIQRLLPKYFDSPMKQNWLVAVSFGTVTLLSLIVGAFLFTLSPIITQYTLKTPSLTRVLRVFSIIIPFVTIINLTTSVFRAKKKLEYQILISNISEPGLKLTLTLIAIYLGLSLIGVVASVIIATILIAFLSLSLMYSKTNVRPNGNRESGSLSEFYNFSVPMIIKDIGTNLYQRADILMVGIFLTSSAVGIYRISAIISTVLSIPLGGINQLFPPIASELHTKGKRDDLESIYSIITRWVFTIVLLPTLALIIYSPQVLVIFGPDFTEGEMVLALFAVSQLVNAVSGPCGKLLIMTDHQYLNVINRWVMGISNIGLNYVLIQELGLIGAGLATASVLAMVNVLRVVEVWHFERLFPYNKAFWKPIVAALGCLPLMLGVRTFLNGFMLLIIGSMVGFLTYVLLLFIFGVQKEDIDFYNENIRPIFQ